MIYRETVDGKGKTGEGSRKTKEVASFDRLRMTNEETVESEKISS